MSSESSTRKCRRHRNTLHAHCHPHLQRIDVFRLYNQIFRLFRETAVWALCCGVTFRLRIGYPFGVMTSKKEDQFAASPRNATCAFHFRPGFISPTKRSGARRPRESCIDDLQPHTASPTPNSRYFRCRESRRLLWIFDHLPTRGHHESRPSQPNGSSFWHAGTLPQGVRTSNRWSKCRRMINDLSDIL